MSLASFWKQRPPATVRHAFVFEIRYGDVVVNVNRPFCKTPDVVRVASRIAMSSYNCKDCDGLIYKWLVERKVGE